MDTREPSITIAWHDREHARCQVRFDTVVTKETRLRIFSGSRIAVEKAVKDFLFNAGFLKASKHVAEDFADSWAARYEPRRVRGHVDGEGGTK